MKISTKKAYILEAIFLIITILNFFFSNIFGVYKYFIYLIPFVIIIKLMYGIGFNRNSNDQSYIRTILICVFIYYLIIYLLGLKTGFYKSIYSYSLQNLLKNILPTIGLIVLMEISRYELINKTDKNKIVLMISLIMFILFEISINYIAYDFSVKDNIYQFIGLLVLPSISKNILMTMLVTKTDLYPGIIYRLFMEVLVFLLPIEPSLGMYINSIIYILFPIIITVIIINNEKIVKIRKPSDKKNKLFVPIVIVLLILVLFNSGLIKYQIMIIGSESMKNYLDRGDAIMVNKLNDEEKRTVKEGEILVYKYNNRIISHRVVEIRKVKNHVYYKTKGDNNNQEDKIVIGNEKIIGKVAFRIRYIGKPSVWLNDLFK